MKNIDWSTVEETCPKALKLAKEFSLKEDSDFWNGGNTKLNSMRWLFDFFDEYLINCAANPHINAKDWCYTIYRRAFEREFPDRRKAEVAMFTKAFELLESML